MLRFPDFYCENCDIKFDRVVKKDVESFPCPECKEDAPKVVLATPRIGQYGNPTARAAALKARAKKHSIDQARKNPEKIASKLGGKPKAQSTWNIRNK